MSKYILLLIFFEEHIGLGSSAVGLKINYKNKYISLEVWLFRQYLLC